MRIYLAGGFRTEWRDLVKNQLDGFDIYDPKEKENGTKKWTVDEYVSWDLHFIRQSDIVLIYVDTENKSCIGLSVEAGYAKGLNKTVILVLQPNHKTIEESYLIFLTAVADVTFDNLPSAIYYLSTFSK